MAIDGAVRGKLEAGTKLVAKYRGTQYVAEVIVGDGEKPRYRLADGREFKSPSAAGSAVMGGVACNGWRFWSLEGEASGGAAKPAKAKTEPRAARKAQPAGARPKAARKAAAKPRKAAKAQPARSAAEEAPDRKSTRLNSSHIQKSRMPSSA